MADTEQGQVGEEGAPERGDLPHRFFRRGWLLIAVLYGTLYATLRWWRGDVPMFALFVAVCAASVAWLVCWRLEDSPAQVSRPALLMVWLIWVFVVSPFAIYAIGRSLESSYVVLTFALAVALAVMRRRVLRKWHSGTPG